MGSSLKTRRVGLGLLCFTVVAVGVCLWLFQTSKPFKILAVRTLPGSPAVVKEYGLPAATRWKPVGEKALSSDTNPNSLPVTFGRSLHTDVHGSDEIATAIAPMFEEAWTVEEDMFLAEGPVFDSEGNLYFCPIMNSSDALVVSIEPEQGKRRWAFEHFNFGCGTPYVLIDPDTGEDVIYLGVYDRAMAITTAGEVIWDVPTGLPALNPELLESNKHSFGVNYLAKQDALVASMGDGYVYILDRKTGRPLLQEPYMLPGAPTKVIGGSLPDHIVEAANEDGGHMFGQPRGEGGDNVISSVLHVTAGEKQKVTNNFSIDSNTGRIWIAATVTDEADGTKDGWSEAAALYGLDVVDKGEYLDIEVASITEVPGGTASTPAVSADGSRIYIANAFDQVYAVSADNGEIIWSTSVGDKVTGSLVVSADNNELYANTKTAIVKLFDRGDQAETAWVSSLNMFEPGRFQSNFNMLGAEVGANGIAFMASVGFMAGNLRLPFQVGAGFMDRETGEIKYFIEGGDDSVSSTVTGPDGALYNGNSPLRRVLARAILGKDKSPQKPRGGVTKFKPVHYELYLRDVVIAARDRAANAATIETQTVRDHELWQMGLLLDQAQGLIPELKKEPYVDLEKIEQMDALLELIDEELGASGVEFRNTAGQLQVVVDLLGS